MTDRTQMITGPYQVDDNDLETHETLDPLDLDSWYLIINGSMVFFETKQRAIECKNALNAYGD